MTTTPDPTAGIIAGVQRMLEESRAIDTKAAIQGITANRTKNGRRIARKQNRRTL